MMEVRELKPPSNRFLARRSSMNGKDGNSSTKRPSGSRSLMAGDTTATNSRQKGVQATQGIPTMQVKQSNASISTSARAIGSSIGRVSMKCLPGSSGHGKPRERRSSATDKLNGNADDGGNHGTQGSDGKAERGARPKLIKLAPSKRDLMRSQSFRTVDLDLEQEQGEEDQHQHDRVGVHVNVDLNVNVDGETDARANKQSQKDNHNGRDRSRGRGRGRGREKDGQRSTNEKRGMAPSATHRGSSKDSANYHQSVASGDTWTSFNSSFGDESFATLGTTASSERLGEGDTADDTVDDTVERSMSSMGSMESALDDDGMDGDGGTEHESQNQKGNGDSSRTQQSEVSGARHRRNRSGSDPRPQRQSSTLSASSRRRKLSSSNGSSNSNGEDQDSSTNEGVHKRPSSLDSRRSAGRRRAKQRSSSRSRKRSGSARRRPHAQRKDQPSASTSTADASNDEHVQATKPMIRQQSIGNLSKATAKTVLSSSSEFDPNQSHPSMASTVSTLSSGLPRRRLVHEQSESWLGLVPEASDEASKASTSVPISPVDQRYLQKKQQQQPSPSPAQSQTPDRSHQRKNSTQNPPRSRSRGSRTRNDRLQAHSSHQSTNRARRRKSNDSLSQSLHVSSGSRNDLTLSSHLQPSPRQTQRRRDNRTAAKHDDKLHDSNESTIIDQRPPRRSSRLPSKSPKAPTGRNTIHSTNNEQQHHAANNEKLDGPRHADHRRSPLHKIQSSFRNRSSKTATTDDKASTTEPSVQRSNSSDDLTKEEVDRSSHSRRRMQHTSTKMAASTRSLMPSASHKRDEASTGRQQQSEQPQKQHQQQPIGRSSSHSSKARRQHRRPRRSSMDTINTTTTSGAPPAFQSFTSSSPANVSDRNKNEADMPLAPIKRSNSEGSLADLKRVNSLFTQQSPHQPRFRRAPFPTRSRSQQRQPQQQQQRSRSSSLSRRRIPRRASMDSMAGPSSSNLGTSLHRTNARGLPGQGSLLDLRRRVYARHRSNSESSIFQLQNAVAAKAEGTSIGLAAHMAKSNDEIGDLGADTKDGENVNAVSKNELLVLLQALNERLARAVSAEHTQKSKGQQHDGKKVDKEDAAEQQRRRQSQTSEKNDMKMTKHMSRKEERKGRSETRQRKKSTSSRAIGLNGSVEDDRDSEEQPPSILKEIQDHVESSLKELGANSQVSESKPKAKSSGGRDEGTRRFQRHRKQLECDLSHTYLFQVIQHASMRDCDDVFKALADASFSDVESLNDGSRTTSLSLDRFIVMMKDSQDEYELNLSKYQHEDCEKDEDCHDLSRDDLGDTGRVDGSPGADMSPRHEVMQDSDEDETINDQEESDSEVNDDDVDDDDYDGLRSAHGKHDANNNDDDNTDDDDNCASQCSVDSSYFSLHYEETEHTTRSVSLNLRGDQFVPTSPSQRTERTNRSCTERSWSAMGSLPEGQQELESKTLLLSLDIMQRPIEPQDLDDDRIMVNDMEYDDDETGLRMKYSGMLSEESGKPCGHGKLQYLDRPSQQKRNPKHLKDLAKNHDFQLRWYKGQFVHGVKNGFGQSCYWSGATYKGFFSQNMKNGHGTLDFPDGRRFEGLFEKNVKLEGTMMYEDGSTYSGKFAHGVRHGSNGTYRFGNSALVYVGDFRKDQIEGQGTLTWPNGGKYVGAWKNGVRHGHGTEYRADGSLMRSGKWENGSLIEPEKFDEEPDAQSYEYDEAESNYDSDSDEESYELRPSDI